MFSTAWLRLVVCAWAVAVPPGAAAAQTPIGDATLYRVFLRDGSTLVSYGDYARVGDRLVVSLPLGGTEAAPDLQLLSLPSAAVDWDKTDAYAESARATRYAQTRGPGDFALLSEAVSRALGDIAAAPDPARKVAMAMEARLNVTKWAADHYGYRAGSVAELAGLFDAVISETRAAAGLPNFDLSLIANMAEPPSVPMLPLPTMEESVEQAVRAAALAPDSGERTSLLRSIQTALGSVDRTAAWAPAVRRRVAAALAVEERTDRDYAALVRDSVKAADWLSRIADVTGVERIMRRALREDDRLGQKRPNEMASVMAMLDLKLDAARRLRLARDSFAAHATLVRAYQLAIGEPVGVLRALRPALDQIQHLAGPPRERLDWLASRSAWAMTQLGRVAVPAEAAPAHDLLRSAASLAARAADGRLKAIAARSMDQAWEASSAAAGAILFLDRAVEELRKLALDAGPVKKPS